MNKFNIRIRNLKKAFQREILTNINLDMDNSHFIAITGKSGSGKSTLMNIISLIEEFDDGEYYFNDTKILPQKDYAQIRLDNIGFIFQSYHLIPSLNCRENILLPTIYAKQDVVTEYFEELIERLGISHLMEQDVNTLSGGEKQRVAIARSLILDPSLIIADEPTGNLDVQNRDIIMDLLVKEHQRGRGILLITHDRDVAQIAETQYMLINGELHDYV